MAQSAPERQLEKEPQQLNRSTQERISDLWAGQSPKGLANPIFQEKIAEAMRDPDETERKHLALAAKADVERDTVIRKWAGRTDAPTPWPRRAPTAASGSINTNNCPTSPTGPTETSARLVNMIVSSKEASTNSEVGSSSSMDICATPNDGIPTPCWDGMINEGNHSTRVSPKSAFHVGASLEYSQNDNRKHSVPARKRQKQDRLGATQRAEVDASSSGSATNTGSSSNISRPQPSHFDSSLSLFVEQRDRYPVKELPKWYTSITEKSLHMVKITKKKPPSSISLEVLKNCIGRCEDLSKEQRKSLKLTKTFDELRNQVHKAEILLQVDRYIVRKARILHPENGLPRIFHENANFPADLKADSYQLYLRWYREDFDKDVLRGITTVKGPNRGSDRLDQAYKSKHPATAKYYGDAGLVNRQCWPSQLCLVRDGAHGSSQGGIFGDKEKGTYSIVLSGGGGYHDQDDGNSIVYSGTIGKDFTPTEATQQMILSSSLGNVIRVFRSCNLNVKNKYRPEVGFRYDGLYQIKGHELVDKEKQIYRFKLDRCPGQPEIRWGDGAMGRPTDFEIAEYKALKTKY
ncbi:hypothetical protein DE146DRAFT_156405 [Phaeosphaeria sp. MPI-PUGE-AT-0046c]|nr:hypothetical protein DE146DRAFT_156405 [Phaeosphaeria sp. MPI-PUGE-AT-0046c]